MLGLFTKNKTHKLEGNPSWAKLFTHCYDNGGNEFLEIVFQKSSPNNYTEQLSLTIEISERKVKIQNYLNKSEYLFAYKYEKHYICKDGNNNKILENDSGDIKISDLSETFGDFVFKTTNKCILNYKNNEDHI
jgi:hypothetical protein